MNRMKRRVLILLTLAFAVLMAARANVLPSDTIAALDAVVMTDSVAPVDTIVLARGNELPDSVKRMNKFQQLKYRIKQRIEAKLNEPYDTVRNKGYWFRALKHGKVDLDGGTIEYPKFIKFCWKVYKWGDKAFNSYDTAYVKSTGKNFKFMFMSNQWLDSYNGRPFDGEKALMNSHLTANVGLQLSFMALSVGYSVSVTNLLNRGKVSNKFDFSFTCARFTAEAFYYEYRGKTVITLLPESGPKETITDFTGLHRTTYGLHAYYFFNNRRYTQAAAYCYSKYQRRSAGSFLAGINIHHYDMSVNLDELPPQYLEEVQDVTIPRFLYNDYCVVVGYGFNWVLGKKWLLNFTGAPYIGYRQMLATNAESRASAWSINLRFKIGAVFNHKNYFLGLQGQMDTHRYKSEKHNFVYSIEDFTLLAGIRF